MDRRTSIRRFFRGLGLGTGLLAALLATAAGPADGDAPEACWPDGAGERRALLEWINRSRADAGLPPLLADARLCAVAQGRAEQMVAAGSVESDERSIQAVSRGLLGRGYEHHRWTERAVLGPDDPVTMAGRWGRSAEASYRETVLGPFEELGIGVAEGRDGTALSLLFAVPRLSELTRVSEPLADLGGVRTGALARVNDARRRANRPPVAASPSLDAAAQRYAEEMLLGRFYSHQSPAGETAGDRAAAAGYGPISYLGENIAKGLFSPDEVVERWLGSRGHRQNILHPMAAEMGIGVAFGDTPDGFQVLWVQMFGRRR
ncbi:MAG TPA: CAP domain-containing protein [Thermoanaerobaculia bacterium]|nr:CAP domain-containing protein [Thermoanaerobaculia bacterium]